MRGNIEALVDSVLAPYQITRGTLPSVAMRKGASGVLVSDIAVGSLVIGEGLFLKGSGPFLFQAPVLDLFQCRCFFCILPVPEKLRK